MGSKYIAGYLRISDDDDGDLGEGKRESNSIENQRKLIESFVKNHRELSNYQLKEFIDDGRSGVNFNRPGIQLLLEEIKKNKVQCIIVKDLSRFGRNYIEAGDYIEQIFPFLGVRFIAIADNFDSFQNLAGIEIGIKNIMHDLYSRDLSKKIKSTKAIMQKQGNYNGGKLPFGYRRSSEIGKQTSYSLDPEAAQIVKKIFALAANGTLTAKIAEQLNQEGILTPEAYQKKHKNMQRQPEHGKKTLWTSSQVASIIQNEAYLGTLVSRKYNTVQPGKEKRTEESQYIKFEGHHQRLIEKDVFETAQKAVQTRKKRNKYKSSQNLSPLTGKIKCGRCGYAMSFKHATKHPYYYCRMGNSCGSHTKIESRLLERAILDMIQKFTDLCHTKNNVKQETWPGMLSTIPKIKKEEKSLQIKKEHCAIHRLKLFHQWKEGNITEETYIAEKNSSYMQEAKYAKKLNQVSQRLSNMELIQEQLEQNNALPLVPATQNLTKTLADGWIQQIEVSSSHRIEIKWNMKDMMEEIFTK